VSAVLLLEHSHLAVQEGAGTDRKLGVSKIYQQHIASILRVEIFLPEHTVVKSDGGRLVDKADDVELSDASSFEDGLALLLSEVGGHCHHTAFVLEFVDG